MLSLKTEKCFFVLFSLLFVLLLIAYHLFPLNYRMEINNVANELSVDPSIIASIIKLESDFDELALSHSGAFGLMQLMPDTANWLAEQYLIQGTWREPVNNIKLGTFYFQTLLTVFENDLHHALNAYHMGPNRLKSVLEENASFKESNYSSRIHIYQTIYKILYNGYFLYPGE